MAVSAMTRLVAAKEARRLRLAHLPVEEKIRNLVHLQAMAAPILRQRGRNVRVWRIESPPPVRREDDRAGTGIGNADPR